MSIYSIKVRNTASRKVYILHVNAPSETEARARVLENSLLRIVKVLNK